MMYIETPPNLDGDPLDLSTEDQALICGIVNAVTNVTIRAAHIYDRKGYITTDRFVGVPNPSYRSSSDPIILQLSVVIDPFAHRDEYETLTEVYQRVQDSKQAADIEAQEREVAAAAAALEAAQRRLDSLKTGE